MKAKRFISIILLACMLFATATLFSSCGILNIFKKKIDSGTVAAQLLLANERLDENVVGKKIDIGLTPNQKSVAQVESKVTYTASTPKRTRSIVPLGATMTNEESGERYTWSGFSQLSPSMVEFTQFMESVEHEASYVAEDIANMKNNVGVVDSWVKMPGGEEHMLRVYESKDVLIVKGIYGDYHVYYRYTDENAKNVYEMYSFMSYDDGTTGEIRTMLIPGERCEYMFNCTNGFSDYFIAENSRGYWMATRFGYNKNPNGEYKSSSFSPYIVKDGLGFGSFLTIDTYNPNIENAWYVVFDPQNNRELFRITDDHSCYTFNLYASGIKSGLVSMSSNNARDAGDGIFMSNEICEIETSKGTYYASKQHSPDTFTFYTGDVQYDYGEEAYEGIISFVIEKGNLSIDDACTKFGEYANSIGLELHCDMSTVSKSTDHASILAENFGESFEWNGYKMNSLENVELGRDVLQNQYDSARALVDEVKDYPVVNSRQMLSKNAHFAEITGITAGENSYENGIITIAGITLATEDTDLFENGGEYVLKIALSLLDENGNPISVNTVPLAKPTNEMPVQFGGGQIAVSAGGNYIVPKNLTEGRYAVVAYIATYNGGIRVSEMKKVSFFSAIEGKLESAAMDIDTSVSEGNLEFKYSIKNSITIEMEATKESYSYDEIKRAMDIQILAHGAPFTGAVLEYADGSTVPSDQALTTGSYRMMCYLATSDGLAQSYVYLNFK